VLEAVQRSIGVAASRVPRWCNGKLLVLQLDIGIRVYLLRCYACLPQAASRYVQNGWGGPVIQDCVMRRESAGSGLNHASMFSGSVGMMQQS
jgi:hypothetical protein